MTEKLSVLLYSKCDTLISSQNFSACLLSLLRIIAEFEVNYFLPDPWTYTVYTLYL